MDLLGEINLRQKWSAGEILEKAEEIPKGKLLKSDVVTLFVHGFNVDRLDAINAYAKMSQRLDPHVKESAFHIYWPGDRFENSIFSALAFSWMLQKSIQSADLIANLFRPITHAQKPIKLRIVAHSLGCRLVLEFVHRIKQSIQQADGLGHIEFELLVLMAAAVQRYKLEPGQTFDMATHGAKTTLIFWSRKDRVLQFAFPLGMRAAEMEITGAFKGGAVGRGRYTPRKFDHKKIDNIQRPNGHSDYWGDKAVAARINDELAPGRTKVQGRIPVEHTIIGRAEPTRKSGIGRLDPSRPLNV